MEKPDVGGSRTPGGRRGWLNLPRITPVHWSELEKVFLAVGFRFIRQEGSHRSYFKPGVARPIVIPAYRQVPVAIIRNNLKTAGISREEYFRMSEKI